MQHHNKLFSASDADCNGIRDISVITCVGGILDPPELPSSLPVDASDVAAYRVRIVCPCGLCTCVAAQHDLENATARYMSEGVSTLSALDMDRYTTARGTQHTPLLEEYVLQSARTGEGILRGGNAPSL